MIIKNIREVLIWFVFLPSLCDAKKRLLQYSAHSTHSLDTVLCKEGLWHLTDTKTGWRSVVKRNINSSKTYPFFVQGKQTTDTETVLDDLSEHRQQQ